MITISAIAGRILQSVEFFRSGFGRYLSLFMEKLVAWKWAAVPLLIWGVVRLSIGAFSLFCSCIRDLIGDISAVQTQSGGYSIVAIANTILPLDETIALLVAWAGLYATCAGIRFARAAWSAVPFKAS